jgi:hypothetical protein
MTHEFSEAEVVLRITQSHGADAGAVMRLEGRIAEESAMLLEFECKQLLQDRAEVSLDLAGVDFVDRLGLEVLGRLSHAGAEILCPSGPVASVLEGAGIPVTLEPGDLDGNWH